MSLELFLCIRQCFVGVIALASPIILFIERLHSIESIRRENGGMETVGRWMWRVLIGTLNVDLRVCSLVQ